MLWNYLLYIDTQLASTEQTKSPGRPRSLLAGLSYRVLTVNMLYKISHGDKIALKVARKWFHNQVTNDSLSIHLTCLVVTSPSYYHACAGGEINHLLGLSFIRPACVGTLGLTWQLNLFLYAISSLNREVTAQLPHQLPQWLWEPLQTGNLLKEDNHHTAITLFKTKLITIHNIPKFAILLFCNGIHS